MRIAQTVYAIRWPVRVHELASATCNVMTTIASTSIEQDELQMRLAYIATRSDDASVNQIADSLSLHQDAEYKKLSRLHDRETDDASLSSPSKKTRTADVTADPLQTATTQRGGDGGEINVDGRR